MAPGPNISAWPVENKTHKPVIKNIRIVNKLLIKLYKQLLVVLKAKLFWLAIFILGHTLFMLLLSYLWLNQPVAYGDEESLVGNQALIYDYFFHTNSNDTNILNQLVLINVAYDKEFVDVVDEIGIPSGKIDITDRGKLAQLFKILNATNQHKFAFCDIYFNPLFSSANDSLLETELAKTHKLLIPALMDGDSVIKPKFDVKYALSNYQHTTMNYQFFKYQYLHGGEYKSIPLNMYEQTEGYTIQKKGLFYFSNAKLCLNSLILNFPIRAISKYTSQLDNNYYELGTDILNDRTPEEVQNMLKDKIVLVGDFVDRDIHATVFGAIPGVIINYNAYHALIKGQHILPFSLIMLLGLFYILVNYFILVNKNTWLAKAIEKLRLGKTTNAIIGIMSIVALFSILSILIYFFYEIHLNLLILAFYTVAYAFVVRNIRNRRIANNLA